MPAVIVRVRVDTVILLYPADKTGNMICSDLDSYLSDTVKSDSKSGDAVLSRDSPRTVFSLSWVSSWSRESMSLSCSCCLGPVTVVCCQACKLNKQDATNRSRWRKQS